MDVRDQYSFLFTGVIAFMVRAALMEEHRRVANRARVSNDSRCAQHSPRDDLVLPSRKVVLLQSALA